MCLENKIIYDYVQNKKSIRQICRKYHMGHHKIRTILGDSVRTHSEAMKIVHKQHPELFKHSEKTKKLQSIKRKEWLKNNFTGTKLA